jgi:predicted transcriptional regulator
MTQKILASKAGVKPHFVCDLEAGRKDSARPATIVKFADALGIDREELLRIGAPRTVRQWQRAIEKARAAK